jgi:voltage-gated potassium channel
VPGGAPNFATVEMRAPPEGRLGRLLEGRVREKGLRPRLAVAVIAAFWAAGVVVFGVVERLVDPDTFDNVWLGMWWAMQTVTTVGYGDVVPGGTAGKVVASFMMLGGLALFAVVTGAITSAFVARAQAEKRMAGDDPLMRQLEELGSQLESIRDRLARLERSS